MKNRSLLPKFGICMPTLEQGQYIEESICSVLDQEYPHLDLVIMDGGSKDNTIQVIKKYEKHLAFWRSGKDAGQSAAINEGLSHTTADIYCWLNSDDILLKGSLFQVAEAWQQGHSFIAGLSAFRNASGESIIWNVTNVPRNAREILEYPLDVYLPQPSVFFASKLWHEIGGLNPSLHYSMDTDLWIRMARAQQLHIIQEQLSWMRLHQDSKTVKSTSMLYREYRKILASNCDMLNSAEFAKLFLASTRKEYSLIIRHKYSEMARTIKAYLCDSE